MLWNYKLITVVRRGISARPRSPAGLKADGKQPQEALEANTGESDRGRMMSGWGWWWRGDTEPLRWPDYSLNRMSSHNKGFIITRWRVAAVWELCTALYSARRPKKCGPALLSVGRFKQQTLHSPPSPTAHKEASVSRGWRTSSLTHPGFSCFHRWCETEMSQCPFDG